MKTIMLFEKWVLQNLEQEEGIELEIWDNGDYLELGKIIIPKQERGSGKGSDIMQKIVDYADSVGKDLRLTPSSDFDLKQLAINAYSMLLIIKDPLYILSFIKSNLKLKSLRFTSSDNNVNVF